MTEILRHAPRPKPVDDVKDGDIRDIIGNMTLMQGRNKQLPREIALNMFRMGVLANKAQGQMTIREIADIVGIHFKGVSYAKTAAKRLDFSEEKFLEYYDEKKCVSWNSFLNKFMPRKKVDHKMPDKVKKRLSAYMRQMKEDGWDSDARKALEEMRDILVMHLPLRESIADWRYIKYYECCCCGAYPPPQDGWDLRVYKDFHHVKYPICQECMAENRPPVKDKLIAMYAGYAINMDVLYDEKRKYSVL